MKRKNREKILNAWAKLKALKDRLPVYAQNNGGPRDEVLVDVNQTTDGAIKILNSLLDDVLPKKY